MIRELFARISLFFDTRKAHKIMDETFGSLKPVAEECGSLDGLRGIPDQFSELAESRLRNACRHLLSLGPEPEALAEQEGSLKAYKRDADDRASACRERSRTIAAGARAAGGVWVAPVSIMLSVVLSGLILVTAGVRLDVPRVGILVCAAALITLNYKRFPAWLAENRATQLADRLDRMIVTNRLRMLAEAERRSSAERWLAERQRELTDLYHLHRSRAERAAELAGTDLSGDNSEGLAPAIPVGACV